MYWHCEECKRYIPDGMSHECTPKPKRSVLLARIKELEAENKRRIEVEGRMVELEKELKRNEEAFAAFGIHKNDVGFWQDKDHAMD